MMSHRFYCSAGRIAFASILVTAMWAGACSGKKEHVSPMDAPNIPPLAASLERCVLAVLASSPGTADDCPVAIDSDVVANLRQQGLPADTSHVRLVALDARLSVAAEEARSPLVDVAFLITDDGLTLLSVRGVMQREPGPGAAGSQEQAIALGAWPSAWAAWAEALGIVVSAFASGTDVPAGFAAPGVIAELLPRSDPREIADDIKSSRSTIEDMHEWFRQTGARPADVRATPRAADLLIHDAKGDLVGSLDLRFTVQETGAFGIRRALFERAR